MRVLITDGNERSALAVTRALGLQQLEVIVGAETRSSLAAASKYCSRSFVYPSPYLDPDSFVERLLEIVEQEQITVVFPISDIAMQLIGKEKSRFERNAIVPAPPNTVFEEVSNKYRLMKLALELQIPIPETIFVPDGRVQDIVDRIPHYPVVVKPGQSVMQVTNGWSKTSVHYAANATELFNLYREKDYLRHPSLIQRLVNGEGQGVFILMDRSEPLVLFAHRRLREKPPSGGVSVLRESIDMPKSMSEYALRLMQHVGWHGVAMVEFKIDRQSEVPLLMEVNGRFWGSLQLALDAGVNFPYFLYQMATGEKVNASSNNYLTGIKSRWLLGDVDHLLLRLFRSKESLHLPQGSASKWQCMLEFWWSFESGTHYEIERLDDPGPFLFEIRSYIMQLLWCNS
jgi:predicted ATP-grasp superfamily ATP-dependent carboligase